MKRKSKIRRSAFTLIEVVVVIVILVTLASIATPLYMNYIKRANVSAAKTQIKMFDDALEAFRSDMGDFPETDPGLQALVAKPNDGENGDKWKGPYLKPAAIPKDPWGHEYEYKKTEDENGNSGYEIVCYGADGQPGGESYNADITNHDGEGEKN